MKNSLYFIWEIVKIVVIALAIVIPIRYFLFQPFIVQGDSMLPNFRGDTQVRDYLIVDEITYRFQTPERGDVIVFYAPPNPTQRYIKRIIGLPGETVEIKNNEVYIKNKLGTFILNENYLPSTDITMGNIKVTLDDNDYFVLGDNRAASSDSRSWGTLPKHMIIGKVLFRLWPIDAFAKFTTPIYQLTNS